MIGDNFNIDEIFEIAEQIERNGAKFYRLAAESVSDTEHKSFLTEMAVMEDSHEEYFVWLRNKFREHNPSDMRIEPGDEAAMYLQAIAEGQIFDLNEDPASKVQGKNFEEILRQAIMAEKDTVLFYLSIKNTMTDETERKKVDAIIGEEMSHVRMLSKRLQDYLKNR